MTIETPTSASPSLLHETDRPFHILSLSGGGYLGLYTISILAELERRYGTPIAKKFDLLAGTSVGGILALCLAAEIPAQTIKTTFEAYGEKIFSDRPAPTGAIQQFIDLCRSAGKPKYNGTALREIANELLGPDTLIKDLKHRILVPAVNLTKGGPQVFKTGHHPNFKTDPHRKAVEVALATSAAPTYFPLAEMGDTLYADGGLYANSPDLFAVHEAEHFLGQSRSNIHLLSIGTTTTQFSFSHVHGKNLGILGWATDQRLVNVIIASQQRSVDYIVGHQLGDRYLRIDTLQSKEQERHLALDVATPEAQKTIRGMAEATIQEKINDPHLQNFMAHNATPPTFFNA